MASSQAVYLKSGDQPRAFSFGSPTVPVTAITANQASFPVYKEAVYSTFQAIVLGTAGAQTATVTIQCSNDDNTGRGFVPPGNSAPGFWITTSSGTTAITSPQQQFTQALVGALVYCAGVPAGTTIATVTNAGAAVLSGNASATSAGVQAGLYGVNWCSTPLGTITLSGTLTATDGFTSMAPWRYVRANVTNITGTGASATVLMGV